MYQNREGQRIPEVSFRTRAGSQWVDVTTDELFAGRTVIVFSLPGAFTPTCSSSHVPRYDELAPTFERLGVDEIICVSVNDAFVMDEWQRQQAARHIRFVPDGSGHFTRAMGMLVDRDDLGFGPRSWRYSMLVRDGVIEKQFIEPREPGDPFHVSDADTMLDYLAPNADRPLDVAILGRAGCPHCDRAKAQLDARDIEYAALELHRDFSHRTFRALTGADSFPQVFINGEYIGGADDLEAWLGVRDAA
jgi:peroxiredoxin/glutaredoxin